MEPSADMPAFSAGEWIEAGGVVLASATAGALLGHVLFEGRLGAVVVGGVVGLLVGLTINWYTQCPVCHAQMEARS